MQEHEQDRTDARLDVQQQHAVIMLASRIQQDYDDSATLADMIRIGAEAGLSREAVEEAYRQVVAQPTEKSLRRQFDKSVGDELSALHVTVVWVMATWLAVIFGRPNETVGSVVGFSTLILYPVLVGVLVRRPWFAAALAAGVVMNLVIAFTIRFGPPNQGNFREDQLLFLLPVVIAGVVSLAMRHLVPPIERRLGRKAKGVG